MSLLTKEQFEAIVHEFVGELMATFEGQASRPLSPETSADLKDQLALVAEPNLPAEERVAAAFAVVNQYLESTWQARVEEGYRLYLDLRRAK